jgi:hypothetical protein
LPGNWDVLYQSILTSYYAGQQCQNVLFFRTRTNTPEVDVEHELIDLQANINSWFVTGLVNFLNSGWSPATLVTKVVAGADPYQALSNYVNVFGAKGGDGLPPHDAAVISTYTKFHGKRLHGRIYLPGLSESDQTNGVLSNAAYAGLQTIANDLMTRFGVSGSFGSCWGTVFSRKNGATRMPGPPPYTAYNVLAALPWQRMTVSNFVRTQGHRKQR